MNKENNEKKTAVGCLLVAALFFFVLAIYQCNEEREERKAKKEIKQPAPTPSIVDTTRTKRNTIGTFILMTDKDTDSDSYDNPDFDDLIPGEEYDEDFVDRSEGDRELYDEQD